MVTREDPRGRTTALRRLSTTAAAVLVIAGLCAGAAKAASLDGFYGVNVQQVFSGSSSTWQPQLAAMASGGLQLARIDARWANVEPNPPSGGTHNYNWSQYDSIVPTSRQ